MHSSFKTKEDLPATLSATDISRYLTIRDIEDELRDGERGVNGIGARGKKKVMEI